MVEMEYDSGLSDTESDCVRLYTIYMQQSLTWQADDNVWGGGGMVCKCVQVE